MPKTNRTKPSLFILAGPNGAGKTTCAQLLIPPDVPFINADEIAKGLVGFEGVARDVRASRILLERVAVFENRRQSFAIETNLANRAWSRRIERLRQLGYNVTLIFLWLGSVDLAIDRVMERVRAGGHSVPAEVIRRRYRTGLMNFFTMYCDIVDSWLMVDNSSGAMRLVAIGSTAGRPRVVDSSAWAEIVRGGKTDGSKT